MQVVITTDEDAVTYFVAVHRPERPEDWTVELHADDGTVVIEAPDGWRVERRWAGGM